MRMDWDFVGLVGNVKCLWVMWPGADRRGSFVMGGDLV
jgi:hypothetical protein